MKHQFNHTRGAYLERNGAKIYYETTGNPDKPVLLFLHGGFGNLEDFNGILPEFTEEFRFVAIDSRGQGRSTMDSKGLSYELLQKDVEAVLNHLKIDTLTIVGFSDGGIVAYRLAALTSLTIVKLITIGSRGFIKNTLPSRADWEQLTAAVMQQRQPDAYAAYQRLNPEPDVTILIEKLVAMWLDPTESGHPNEKLSDVRCPLLIVKGDDDVILSREAVVEIANTINGSTLLTIPFAKHPAFKDQKAVFMLVVNEFLRKV